MSVRDNQPRPVILDTVIRSKSDWNDSTQKVARTDAQRVLEAMIAEYGIEGAVGALNNQGFEGEAYRYLLNPLHEVARTRHLGNGRQENGCKD